MLKRICVFSGSSSGGRASYRSAAVALARRLAADRIGIVYGGSKVGLMGALADAALEAGGEVIGVIPQVLVQKEIAHNGLTELRTVGSMHERKALMAELADGFIALPGGYGTLEEFCEVLTWAQLGLHQKPCGILNVEGYYNRLLEFFDYTVTEEFVKPELRELVLSEPDPESLIARLASYHAPLVDKWITPQQI